nr:MFS transporter [Pedobacter sp. ASV2]
MRKINNENIKISTVLSFILIPLSGLATDIYLPSFPEMAKEFNVTNGSIQNTMICFLLSYGLAQLFVGSIIDSLGRYRLSLVALMVFTFSNFAIIGVNDNYLVYGMRILQGISTAFIVVGKRAFFVDVYTGDKQKHYTGMITIVWATAPIVAPFLGGYLQDNFGWTANFYLLGMYGGVMLCLEYFFGGESLKNPQPFSLIQALKVYGKLVASKDFISGISVLGVSYSMVMVFSMSAPFIVEQTFNLSSLSTGYCALLSGTALLIGGLAGRFLKKGTLFKKLFIANILQFGLIITMIATAGFNKNLIMLMFFVICVHILGGFIYNRFFTYCLTRFPENAGVASGITSGGSYLITAVISSFTLRYISVTGQRTLGVSYIVLTVMMIAIIICFRRLFISK